MIAVIEVSGHQYVVKSGDIIEVDNQNKEIGDVLSISPLLISEEDGKNAQIGAPVLEGSKVELKVVKNFRNDKVRVFKMHSKKRYSRTFGFRAERTKLEVLSVA